MLVARRRVIGNIEIHTQLIGTFKYCQIRLFSTGQRFDPKVDYYAKLGLTKSAS